MSTPATAPDVSTGSSPAPSSPTPVTGQALMDSLTAPERDSYHLTGELPERVSVGPKKSDVPAASSAAPKTEPDSSSGKPAEQAAATAATPSAASEPAKPRTEGHKGNAETRVKELAPENARLREEVARLQGRLEALERGSVKPDARPGSSPDTPPTQAEYKRFMAMPDAPKEADFDSFAEFTAAVSVFITDKRWQEHQATAQQHSAIDREVQRVEQIAATAAERVEKALKNDPSIREQIDPRLLEIDIASVRRLKGEKVGPQHVLAEHIAKSEYTDQLLIHFSTEDGRKDWARLCRLPPDDLFVAFGRLESRFDGSAASTPAPKTVSDAPTPPVTLGNRTADTADPLEAAIKRKDTAAYIREANRRDLAAMGL